MKKTLLTVFSLSVVVLCLVPLGANIFGYTAVNRENRPLARKARLVENGAVNLDYPTDFDDYWADHFGLREELVTAVNSASLALFNDTLSEKAVAGKNNFLYFSETMGDYTGLNVLSDDDISRTATVLRLVGEYANSTGADFVFSVAPNKNTVYPEYMPRRIKQRDFPGNMEKLYSALDAAGVCTIDFAQMLRTAKDDGLLYYRQDTHWNERGALIAYNAIMERIMGAESYNAYDDVTSTDKSGYYGDLHNFVLPTEESSLLYPDFGIYTEYILDEGARPERDANFGTASDVNKDKSLLLYRDSFGEALIPLLSTNLGRAVYSQSFPYDLTLGNEDFDLVMIELVERNIPNLLTSLPLVPAIEKQLDPRAVAIGFTTYKTERSGYINSYVLSNENVSAKSQVFIRLDNSAACTYEAMPTYVDGVLHFAITLPADTDGKIAQVFMLG